MPELDFLFKPRSIAVIGASRSPAKIGYAVLKNIIDIGFKGNIYPINPREDKILDLQCYQSIKDAGAVDLAVISIPETGVIDVAQNCGKAGVKGLVVITAGFKEVGGEGLQRENKLMEICREYGMSMLGPNCVGLIDTHTPLNASFTPAHPLPGDIAFISQSGAMLISILDWSFAAGIGFSRFISLGNKANLNETDFITSSAADPNTRVILCYIEDVVDGKQFLTKVKEASLKKPVVILKSGTSAAGAQAASSHTGALAGSDKAYELSFKETGVIRAESMEELFQQAMAFSRQPIPRGKKVGIVTNAGGPGIITTDAIENAGLEMANFSKETTDYLRKNLPAEANIYNPVDILGDASPERYRQSLEIILADNNTDSIIVLFSPTAVIDPLETAHIIVELKEKYPQKPVFVIFMGGDSLKEARQEVMKNNIPGYIFPEPAVKAIKGMTTYFHFLQESRKVKEPVQIKGDHTIVKSVLYDALKEKRLVLLGEETSRIAEAYGIPVNFVHNAQSAEEAGHISENIGFPVAMKIASHHIVHKTDVGGVKLWLNDVAAVKKTYEEKTRHVRRLLPETPIYGVEIQKMAEDGMDLIIGVNRDVQFGSLIAFGLGGIYVNLIEDVAFNLASQLQYPEEIDKLIRKTKAYTLLRGYRGKKPYDIKAIIDAIARVAKLAEDFPEIVEMDINPIRAFRKGVTALDIKITISPARD